MVGSVWPHKRRRRGRGQRSGGRRGRGSSTQVRLGSPCLLLPLAPRSQPPPGGPARCPRQPRPCCEPRTGRAEVAPHSRPPPRLPALPWGMARRGQPAKAREERWWCQEVGEMQRGKTRSPVWQSTTHSKGGSSWGWQACPPRSSSPGRCQPVRPAAGLPTCRRTACRLWACLMAWLRWATAAPAVAAAGPTALQASPPFPFLPATPLGASAWGRHMGSYPCPSHACQLPQALAPRGRTASRAGPGGGAAPAHPEQTTTTQDQQLPWLLPRRLRRRPTRARHRMAAAVTRAGPSLTLVLHGMTAALS